MVIDHPIFLESIRFIRSHLGANDLNYLEKNENNINKLDKSNYFDIKYLSFSYLSFTTLLLNIFFYG